MRDVLWETFIRFIDYHPDTTCWLWTGATDAGRPRFWREGAVYPAARFAFECVHDVSLGGQQLKRMCDPLCVNPAHARVPSIMRRTLADRGPPVPAIAAATTRVYEVPMDLLNGTSRKQPIAEARQVLMFLCYKIKFMSYPQIGQKLGRHHTTVMHGVERIAQRLVSDSTLSERLERIQAELCPAFETV